VFQAARCYRNVMIAPAQIAVPPFQLQRMFAWRRLRVVGIACLILFVMFTPTWKISYWVLFGRLCFFGFCGLVMFGLFEVWPRKLPSWVARWVLQVAAVAFVMPIAVWIGYTVTNQHLPEPWWRDSDRLTGFFTFSFLTTLVAPWIAVAALLKQIKEESKQQALAFALERSQFEQQVLNARLQLLQAQVEPHFLFNTLANVRELVTTGSPNAPVVLESLIAYLRAAVPRINQPMATMAQEVELARAYLDVMHMRMPDRLQFSIHADGAAMPVPCPPMTLMTLVENAMRHGIDPTEEGGRIDVNVSIRDGMCYVDVVDTGAGIKPTGDGLKTGLANLRERLRLVFGERAALNVVDVVPRGVRASLRFPVTTVE
jgi:hypothetical protein